MCREAWFAIKQEPNKYSYVLCRREHESLLQEVARLLPSEPECADDGTSLLKGFKDDLEIHGFSKCDEFLTTEERKQLSTKEEKKEQVQNSELLLKLVSAIERLETKANEPPTKPQPQPKVRGRPAGRKKNFRKS